MTIRIWRTPVDQLKNRFVYIYCKKSDLSNNYPNCFNRKTALTHTHTHTQDNSKYYHYNHQVRWRINESQFLTWMVFLKFSGIKYGSYSTQEIQT